MAPKRAAPGEHWFESARQRARAGSSARISSATFRHFVHSWPSGATKVKSPKGSSPLLPAGASMVASDAVGFADASWIALSRGSLARALADDLADRKELRRCGRRQRRHQRRNIGLRRHSALRCACGCGWHRKRHDERLVRRLDAIRDRTSQPENEDLGIRSSVCVDRGYGRDETEGQRDKQPASRVLRPCLRTHVQHPVSGALIGFCNKPLAPDFLRS